MNIIKGFTSIEALIDNTPGVVAVLGELSKWSRSYSREIGEYVSSDIPGYRYVSFNSIDAATGAAQVVTDAQVAEILSLVQECVLYATSHIRPYDSLDFQNTITTAFYQRIANFQFGIFVDNGTMALPEWISWTSTTNGGNSVKVWLADQAFQNQYDEYHIEVVPPIVNLDHFFYDFGLITQELAAISIADYTDKIQAAKDNKPETYTRILTFNLVNSVNTAQTYPVNIGVLIYGQQGDNIDSEKDDIVAYFLAHSTHTKSEWEAILPDLFKRTEMVILPRYDLLSITNQTQLSSLYKTMMNPVECLAFAKNAIDYYPDSFIQDNTTVFPVAYKLLTIVAVNGDTNIDSAKHLDLLFPDYLPVDTSSEDFNRMDPNTRNWVLFLQRLIVVAENAGTYTTVPSDMRKQTRSGNLYISALYNNINYLVAARSNTALYPGVN